MAAFEFNVILGLSVFLLFISSGYSLSCYQCVSPLNGTCGTFNGTFNFNASADIKIVNCTKSCGVRTEIDGGYGFKIQRGCFESNECSSKPTVNVEELQCRVCNKFDLCNSSHNVVSSIGITTFLLLCLSYLFYLH